MADQLLPLEAWLKKQKPSSKFPDDNLNYFNRYDQVKSWLKQNVYKDIPASLAYKEKGIFNDHGIDHFNAVIKYAGFLLGLTAHNPKQNIMQPYEVYLTLISILLHDAGNIYGRDKHEKQAFDLLDSMGNLAYSCNVEKRLKADIAEVHGGRNEHGEKDTIGTKDWSDQDSYLTCKYRPKAIAAVIRFADEICEDKTRASRFLLTGGKIERGNQIYHKYSESIASSIFDIDDKAVRIEYEIDVKDTYTKYGKEDDEVFLIDEIFARLDKINLERMYCSRFMHGIVNVQRIKASIKLKDSKWKTLKKLSIVLEDSGYPTLSAKLSDTFPDWVGNKLEAQYRGVT